MMGWLIVQCVQHPKIVRVDPVEAGDGRCGLSLSDFEQDSDPAYI